MVGEGEELLFDLNCEKDRLLKLFKMQSELHKAGYRVIAGVDEAGRGPLAGPVVAAAVILKLDCYIFGLNDSKLLSEKKREALYNEISSEALSWAYDVVDEGSIDRINILRATELAMIGAVEKLKEKPDFVLVDAVKLPQMNIPQHAVIKGDRLCASIAAASIMAKVTRDKIMTRYDLLFPEYGFKKHKGYGTREHIESIKKYGFCPIHRRSFSVKGLDISG